MIRKTFSISKWIGDGETEFHKEIKKGRITFFDTSISTDIEDVSAEKSIVYIHRDNQRILKKYRKNIGQDYRTYDRLENISHLAGSICFLSGRGIKALLAKYPSNSKYVLCKLSVSPYWVLGLPGLIRRLKKSSHIEFKGILNLHLKSSFQGSYWIILKNTNPAYANEYLLDESIGIKGFIEYLNSEKINYVILRHFENLPQKHREDGDVDILVADNDLNKVASFLTENSGNEKIGLFGVSTPALAAQIPYYIPHLARKILSNKVIGPAMAYVPSKEDHKNSYIYHCLYHKGLLSGIPTLIPSLISSQSPDNDYSGNIGKLLQDSRVEIDISMESLDAYLKEEGWRPHLDTLRIIATTNKWLKERLKAENLAESLGINVCIIKQGFLINSNLEELKFEFHKNGMEVVKEEVFDSNRVNLAYNQLRGGNWDFELGEDYLPASAMIILDLQKINNNKMEKHRVKHVKKNLRARFDSTKGSYIHITDDTTQAIEYIKVLYPDQYEELISEIKKKRMNLLNNNFKNNFADTILFSIYRIKDSIKRKLIEVISVMINR